MNQLTLRGFDKKLRQKIEELARRKNLSLNKAALELMRKGAGLEERLPSPHIVGNSLDDFIGSWSKSREQELLEAVVRFEGIDESFWG
jgi:hypothetical protein